MRYFIFLLALAFITSCGSKKRNHTSAPSVHIDSTQLTHYLRALASDEFMGRKPFTKGEELTVNYIADEFKKAGIEPGNGDSYFQDVKLVEINSILQKNLTIKTEKTQLNYTIGNEYVATTTRIEESTQIDNSELVFVGYGIKAPEYGWNDYEGVDMKGKTAVVLVNDPGFPNPDSALFKGRTMTYYGRWTYKYEEAARQGADGVFIIHETKAAGYPWSVVKGGWDGNQMVMQAENKNLDKCKMEGWITEDVARELFDKAGFNYDSEIKKASQNGFKPHSLNAFYSYKMANDLKYDNSKNVIGKVTGSKYPDETIIYTAHWDHFGIGEKINGDSIYNGAVDNATGVAAIMEIGRQFAQMKQKPERTVIFLAVTAEEQGLLGSKYYSENPIYPLDKTVANINIDGIGKYGRTRDIVQIGIGQSELDEYLQQVNEYYQYDIVADLNPEKGYFFRSDHINFAKKGVPALYVDHGFDSFEHGYEWGKEQSELYTKNDYHAPSDNFDPATFDAGASIQIAQIMMEVGLSLSNTRDFPKWKNGADFRR